MRVARTVQDGANTAAREENFSRYGGDTVKALMDRERDLQWVKQEKEAD